MSEVKKVARDLEAHGRKAIRGVDGTSVADRIGNTGDTVREVLGNAGDALRDGTRKKPASADRSGTPDNRAS